MKVYLPSPFFAVLLAGCASAQRPVSVSDADLAITHVTVVDVERGKTVPDQAVLIKGNRIVAVTPRARARIANGVRILDGSAKYVIPGLWDMHVHLGSGNPERVEMPLFVAHGVTGVRVMSADRPSVNPLLTPGLDQHRAGQSRIAAGTLIGPRLMAASWAVNGAFAWRSST
jgi:hypothetical protein